MNQTLWDNLNEDERIKFLKRNNFMLHAAIAYGTRKWSALLWFVQEEIAKLY